MKLFVPNNIFASIFISEIKSSYGVEIINSDSALLCSQLEKDLKVIAFIPTLELINHRQIFISKKLGLSLDGVLSNAYLFFRNKDIILPKIKISGDISINEIILSKILFAERFSTNAEISIAVGRESDNDAEHLIVGDENFKNKNFETGVSFSDQIADMIDLPYVNFVFASRDKSELEKFNNLFADVDFHIEEKIQGIMDNLDYSGGVKNFIKNNLSSVYFEITENEIASIYELVKLIYYHGIIDDMFDINFA